MQRWVDQADDDRQPLHRLKDAEKVSTLEWQQFGEGRLALALLLGQNHPLHVGQPILLHEHVLCPTQPDALGTEFAGPTCILGGVGVGIDL